ncbi:DNA polymerase III subunit alpha [Varunaivibrio sulfuroxidans]|uniref:DNA polymerase III subunit alpha n=1 Tax=Varunaivibrio sulfuroxidans TaxID=1773489 RepID=A0A4R3JE55_9PROT|nr:DNA polymerase III subunit alpha [Varunaivibrio sulfuroxidans]TCS64152.1 DNA polymerase III alpha subunit [Varunaivibrio sulfuroxidans]WES31401.1 DNA polymerase III subunit alpha [Varunaivibrio sulfuroxidans]
MAHADFVHLRVHSAYSLSEGATRIKDLVRLCRENRMPAVAVTDTNNLFSALEFSLAASDGGVQPIIGCQVAVDLGADEPRAPRTAPKERARTPALVLLAQNAAGYGNILKLLSRAYLDGEDVDDPKVTLDDLAAHGAGVIALSGGPGGPVGRLLLEGRADDAEKLMRRLAEIYRGRLYVELMRHDLGDEKRTEEAFLDLAYDLDLPLVATNEVFFPDKEMYTAHDALICIAESAYVSQDERRKLTQEHYFKSAGEMKALFADLPEAIANTLVIAKRCAFKVDKIAPILPPFDCGQGKTEEDELRTQAHAGLIARLETQVWSADMDAAAREAAAKPYFERLDYELNIIVQMGFPGYFLIVSDFIKWSKEQGIPVGPGRGSGAGSVVAWALTITDLDPLRFGLLFERFLNPERVSMPDFDIDFCQDRRDEVIHYVQEKYGRDRVAQIITFGKLQARAVIRDVGRVLEMPYGQVDKISKLIPSNPANPMTLSEAINAEPQLREMIRGDETVKRLVDTALPIEGLYRHASTHAAGVVIADRPLDQLVPLYRDPRSDMPVTGFNMKWVESAGLVKFDFLGLKTLTVLAKAVEFAAEGGAEVDLSTIPLNDKTTFAMLARAETAGVFQLESQGMRDVLRQLRPDTFEDIIAVVALYRPGPMENIPSYIKRKHGEETPDYLYPTLEGILKETFGIMIYQEQVMQIAQELSGYTLGSADLLRRAMGKKIKEEMDKQRVLFVEGAEARGVPGAKADEIFDQVAKFAGYGFNKSHAAAYALVAYQTAYMKANYPLEFMAALMTLDMTNTDKLGGYRQELVRIGAPLHTPDINKSSVFFKVERDRDNKAVAIRYALAAIKNVGEAAMRSVVEEREKGGLFRDINAFASRLDGHAVNKRSLENLVRAGAFDGLNSNRRQLLEGVNVVLGHASAATRERESDQIGLFGGEATPAPALRLPEVSDWSVMDRLREEFSAIGFYLSAHPLDAYGKSLERIKAQPIAQVLSQGRSGAVNLAGTMVSKREMVSAKGNKFAFVQFSDASGAFEVTVFSEVLSQAAEMLVPGNSLFIKAAVQFEGDTPRMTAHSMELLDKVTARTASGLKIVIDAPTALPNLAGLLGEVQGKGQGEVRVAARLDALNEVEINLKGRYNITPDILQSVRLMVGVSDVQEL